MPAFPAPKAEISRLWDQAKRLRPDANMRRARFCENWAQSSSHDPHSRHAELKYITFPGWEKEPLVAPSLATLHSLASIKCDFLHFQA